MKKRNVISAVIVIVGAHFSWGAVGPYRNSKNEICEMMSGKVVCLSERAREKEKIMQERRQSRRESLHDRVD